MNKVGIIGGSGFAGEELIRFLLNHDSTTVLAVSSRDRKGHSVSEIVQGSDLVFVDPDAVSYTHLTLPTTSSV